MKKQIILWCIGLITINGWSQIPEGYYNAATGSGYELKNQLYQIISNHNVRSYASLWGLYNHVAYKDIYYENDGTLLDIYSENPNGQDAYTYHIPTNQSTGNSGPEGTNYNREHLIPQSVFSSNSPMMTDAHHILPTDSYVNSSRGNLPFGEVASAYWTSLNGSKKGSSVVPGSSDEVFEPIDEFKGDIARVYFYFATRYQNLIASWNYPMFNHTSTQVFADAYLNILLSWHENDPVSEREIAINNRVYTHQNNRNPFIDHPHFVALIWGESNLSTPKTPNKEEVVIFQNSTINQIVYIQATQPIDELQLFNLQGQGTLHLFPKEQECELRGVVKGVYLLKIKILDSVSWHKIIVR